MTEASRLLFDLAGKTALVTGAASGLGRHFAGVLAGAGAAVVLAGRRAEALEAAARELAAAGRKVSTLALDVTDATPVEAGVASAQAAFGSLDILVNNAGVAKPVPVLDLTEADWDRTLDTNLKGAWLVSRAFGRQAKAAGRPGTIVNVASILGFRVAGQVAAYAASKAGLVQLTRAMAYELARFGLRVNALAPGYVLTDINRDFFATDAGRAVVARIPQRRLGEPDDLDGPLLLLASDASRYMTGTTITVDGGHCVSSL